MSKNLSVYKISFKKFLSTYSAVSDLDLDKIANLDIESSFDYEKEEHYYCYVITTEIEIKKYKKILENNLISFVSEDISDLLLRNEYDISYIKEYLDEENKFIYDIFLEDLDKWIYNRLDTDIVLDIIVNKGIKSLRSVDRLFLKEHYEKGKN
jgi:hypothetical protein